MADTHRDFLAALLKTLNLPVRISGLRAMAAVNCFENPDGNLRWNNPLACTLPYDGSTKLYPDRSGYIAQIYQSFNDGITATAMLYAQPHWAGVRQAIRRWERRGPILDAFTAAYTWVDWANESFDGFRLAPFNVTTYLDARLAHPLLGP